MIQAKLLELDARTMSVGYEQQRLAMIVTPTPDGEVSLDGGYFNESESGGDDGVVPSDSEWYTPTPTPTPTSSALGVGELGEGGGFGFE